MSFMKGKNFLMFILVNIRSYA